MQTRAHGFACSPLLMMSTLDHGLEEAPSALLFSFLPVPIWSYQVGAWGQPFSFISKSKPIKNGFCRRVRGKKNVFHLSRKFCLLSFTWKGMGTDNTLLTGECEQSPMCSMGFNILTPACRYSQVDCKLKSRF